MKKLLFIALSLILLSALVFVGCPTTTEPEAKNLKIGICGCVSGPAGPIGLVWVRSYEMLFNKVNEEGGIQIGNDTYMIQVFKEDNKATPEGATTAATKLVYDHGCKIVMGSISDMMTGAIYQVTSKADVLHAMTKLVVSASLEGSFADVSPNKPLLIRLNHADNEAYVPIFQYLVDNYPDVEKVGFICLDFPEYDSCIEYAKTMCGDSGLTAGAVERVPQETEDFYPVWTRLIQDEPDAVFMPEIIPPAFGIMVKAGRELGFNGPIMFPGPLDPAFALPAGPETSDVITMGIAGDDPDLPASMREIKERWEGMYTEPFFTDGLFAWDVASNLVQLVEKAQSTEPQQLIDTFETMTEPGSFQTVLGPGHVGGLETYGVNRVIVRPVPLSRLMNGAGDYVESYPLDIP